MTSQVERRDTRWSGPYIESSFAVTKTLLAPVDRARFLLQVPYASPDQRYKNVMEAMYRPLREHGLSALYRGHVINILRASSNLAMFKALLGPWNRVFGKNRASSPLMIDWAVGGLAGMCATLFTYPLDNIRTRLALDTEGKFRGAYDCFVKTGRLLSIFRGYSIASQGAIASYGTIHAVFQRLKDARMSKKELTFAETWGLATIAVIPARLIAYPYDTVARHMMMDIGKEKRYKNMFDCGMRIVGKGGVEALWRGCVPNLIGGVGFAAVFAVVDLNWR